MAEITLLVAPPGAGKSTWTEKYMQEQGVGQNLVRISQDDQGKEGHLQLFYKALASGHDIVVDRMNFDKKQRSRYLEPARKAGYVTRIVVIHVSRDTCLERCNARIGHPTIKDSKNASEAVEFFFRSYERVSDEEADEILRLGWVNEKSVLCIWSDLDGTLADVEHRRHHVRPTVEQFYGSPHEIPTELPPKFKPDWKAFFEEMVNDPVDYACKSILDQFSSRYPIVYATGRPYDYYNQTRTWLSDNGLAYPGSSLFMRFQNDMRKDDIVKEIILEFEVKTKYNVFFALDDRDQVVKMLRRHGIKTLQVTDGNF